MKNFTRNLIGILVITACSAGFTSAEEAVRPETSPRVRKQIDTLEKMKKEDPEKFKKVVSERKRKLRNKMKELKEKDPEKFKELKKKMMERRRQKLERLREENPEKYRELMEEKREKYMKNHPHVINRPQDKSF